MKQRPRNELRHRHDQSRSEGDQSQLYRGANSLYRKDQTKVDRSFLFPERRKLRDAKAEAGIGAEELHSGQFGAEKLGCIAHVDQREQPAHLHLPTANFRQSATYAHVGRVSDIAPSRDCHGGTAGITTGCRCGIPPLQTHFGIKAPPSHHNTVLSARARAAPSLLREAA